MSVKNEGGELGSAVVVIGLKDRAKFQAAHDKLVAYVMEKAEDSGSDGHVRIRQWSHAGATLNTLTFPGLPVPLEVTGGFQGDWLVLGMTPQAVISASQL